MEVKQILHMKGGEGKESYAQNSTPQRLAMLKVKHIVAEAIEELCRFRVPDCIRIADLGCSSGPNALVQVEEMIDSIDKACLEWNQKKPCVQIFLNDLEGNDFNNVFKSLPSFYNKIAKLRNRKSGSCFIAAMPGSFHGRLFPSKSLHFVHSSNSLHWLSEVPRGLITESGMPLNKGNIYIAQTSPPSVHKTYLDQFEKDFTSFLKMRCEEIVPRGHLVIVLISKVAAEDGYDSKELLGLTLHDMVKEGLIKEAQLDSFDLPIYNPAAKEVKDIIEKEGSFRILHLGTFKSRWNDVYKADISKGNRERGEYISMFIRAVFECLLARHFGEDIMDELFDRYAKKVSDYIDMGKGLVNHVVVSLVKNEEVGLSSGFRWTMLED